jgi:hypothetical protein
MLYICTIEPELLSNLHVCRYYICMYIGSFLIQFRIQVSDCFDGPSAFEPTHAARVTADWQSSFRFKFAEVGTFSRNVSRLFSARVPIRLFRRRQIFINECFAA